VRAAIDSVRSRRAIDEKRIYAIGVSGGGMMALLVAARMPEVWGGVSAWVPVTDLKQWHADSRQRKNKYARDIEGVCGGPPGHSPGVDEQYAIRSPVTHLGKTVPAFGIDINTGIHDGFTGSVPVGHAIRAFNRIAEVKDRLADDSIAAMEGNRAVPVDLLFHGRDPLYATRPVLFRRTSGNARITVFDGGHDIVHEAGLTWLEAQARGAAPVWQVAPHEPLVLGVKAAASGR
jgi:pimeloyl-ACP methyl ester carboxylesterase